MGIKHGVAAGITAGVVIFGGFAGAMYLDNSLRMERKAVDYCWIKGGTYTEGKCEMPQDRMTPEEKVCMGMRGSYGYIKDKDGTLKCFKQDGTQIPMPDLRGREVTLMKDGTVSVKGPDRIDYYTGLR
jgi:hypothetical protein